MKKVVALLLVAVMALATVPVLAGTPIFSDIEGHWARDDIIAAASRGIFSGNPDGTFAPEERINRAQLAAIMARSLELPLEEDPSLSFRDAWQIPSWARKEVAAVVKADLMQGRSDGAFGPLAPVPREEVAIVMVRALGLAGEAEGFNGSTGFTDDDQISSWARGYVAVARDIGLFQGDNQGRFLPHQSLTRAQGARVILELLDLQAENPVLGWSGNSETQRQATTTTNLNFRSQPTTQGDRLGLIPAGTTVPVRETVTNSSEETWLKVTYQGREGYIAAWHTQLTPPLEEDKPPAGEQGKILFATTTTHLNVRTGPSLNHDRIGLLAPNTNIPVEEVVENQGEKWLRINYNGQTAYIAGWHTTLTEAELEPEDPAKPDEDSKGEPPESKPEEGSAQARFQVVDRGNSQGLQLVLPGQRIKVAILSTNLNVRAEPGTDSHRIGGLPAGSEVTVHNTVTAGGEEWHEITYQGRKGFIAAWYTRVENKTQNPLASGLNEIVLTRVDDYLFTLTVAGTKPLAGKLNTDIKGHIALEVSNADLPSAQRSLNGPFDRLGVEGNTIFLEHSLEQVESQLRTTGEGGLQVLLALNPDDPNLGEFVGWKPEGNLQGKVIVLDPGHGGSDPGAIGTTYGTREKDVVLDIARKTAFLLEAKGATVIMTRTSDRDVSLGERVNISNSNQPDLFVSIHADYNYNPATGGSTVYYCSTAPRAMDNYQLGVSILDSLVEHLNLRRVGVRDSRYFVLRNNTVPAVLVETAFLSNSAEEALLRQESFRQQAAEGIAAGIANFLQ